VGEGDRRRIVVESLSDILHASAIKLPTILKSW